MLSFKEFLLEEEALNEALITFNGKAYPKFGNVLIVAGGAGCYPAGTEYFDGAGWRKIENYSGGPVLQYQPDSKKAELTEPDEFIKLPVDQFYRLKNRRVDFTTSETHRHLVVNEKTGKTEVKLTSELYNNHNSLVRGNKAKLLTSFYYDGPGIDLSEDQIRLKVAVFADGHMLPTKEPKVRFSIKKDRKIAALKYLLNRNNIQYKEYEERGFTRFEFKYDSKDKEFEAYWYNCNKKQLEIVCDEVIKWDGSVTKIEGKKNNYSFSSTSKKSTDFVQFAFSSIGKSASIYVDSREGCADCYDLRISHSEGVGISKNNRSEITTTFDKVDSEDGLMFCFAVPSGYFVVRQNNKIYVSGNSGKGFIINNLVGMEGKIFDVDALKKLVLNTDMIKSRVKKELNIDLDTYDLKNPEHVYSLHSIVDDYLDLVDKKEKAFIRSALTAPRNRKPNIIFDNTLKNIKKLHKIVNMCEMLGYESRNIHLVWVANKFSVAVDQNKNRERVVPDDIMIQTHEGASRSIKSLADIGEPLARLGEFYIAFNQMNVDVEFKKSNNGGKAIVKSGADYVKIKEAGSSKVVFDKRSIEKIKSYVPNPEVWDD